MSSGCHRCGLCRVFLVLQPLRPPSKTPSKSSKSSSECISSTCNRCFVASRFRGPSVLATPPPKPISRLQALIKAVPHPFQPPQTIFLFRHAFVLCPPGPILCPRPLCCFPLPIFPAQFKSRVGLGGIAKRKQLCITYLGIQLPHWVAPRQPLR